MTSEHRSVTDLELQAYLDGELADRARKQEIEVEIENSPRLAEQLARDRAIAEALRTAGASVEREPVPDRLLAAVDRADPGPLQRLLHSPAPAMAVAIALSMSVGWVAREWVDIDYPEPTSTQWEGLALFPPPSRVEAPLPALSEAVLSDLEVETGGLLSLDEHGLKLTHASTRLSGDRYVRELHYRSEAGNEVSVMASVPGTSSETSPRRVSLSGRPMVYWTQGNAAIGVTGDLGSDEIARIAESIQERLAQPGPSVAPPNVDPPVTPARQPELQAVPGAVTVNAPSVSTAENSATNSGGG